MLISCLLDSWNGLLEMIVEGCWIWLLLKWLDQWSMRLEDTIVLYWFFDILHDMNNDFMLKHNDLYDGWNRNLDCLAGCYVVWIE